MKYKLFLLFLIFFLISCESHKSKVKYTDSFELYSNKGFALIYNDKLYKNKTVNRKINERSLIDFNDKLEKDTVVKITNLLNGKDLIAKIGKNSKYPLFYNSVISNRIAKDLDIDKSEPYIKIQTINKVKEGGLHIVNAITNNDIDLVINTTKTQGSIRDSYSIRRTSLTFNIPYYTTIAGAKVAVDTIEHLKKNSLKVKSLQDLI